MTNEKFRSKGSGYRYSKAANKLFSKTNHPGINTKMSTNRLSSLYEHLGELGAGTYGIVTKARSKKVKNRLVALKRIMVKAQDARNNNGINFTALREIKVLRDMNHANVIKLYDVHVQDNTIVLALELCVTDLETIIKDVTNVKLTTANIKAIMQMTLQGLNHLHTQFILHRDLKPNNLLLNDKGILKLADFGFARSFGSPGRPMSLRVATIYYRCPELLLCVKRYGSAIDMWSVGCIFAELMLRRPYLQGASLGELDQLEAIFKNRGVPTLSDWPGIIDLGDMQSLVTGNQGRYERKPFDKIPGVFGASSDAIMLLNNFLNFDPNKRISCAEALKHRYFTTAQPAPSKPADLPLPVPFELREGSEINNKNNRRANNNNNNNGNNTNEGGSGYNLDGGVSRALAF
jgi:cyclin-dependent kinase 7